MREASVLFVVAVLLVFSGPAHAETGLPAPTFLTENTLIYPGVDGEKNLIHFGRFGNFDWYFPCKFESGTWSLDPDNNLSLAYDNTDFAAQTFRLAPREGSDGLRVEMIAPERTFAAVMEEGNTLPYT
ncbi:MAG: hypothetical protein HOK98_05985 [Rhodospirillaceae bacterium]|jgi:hypothetical protein|nr:hypothetical protein [Rhodospirillaceae bacterium]MBT5945942.1 hypothetical protein [Rhodospirillaceae bacterium]MBT6404540.1 hypothetical protein [Rhodospirillaceae bacterium]MBT6535715.1 hypothetical protein [Rhodospirillaceae bacterium]MBT7362911.1 hypothetical protein [Rhodospirillaceae bacterium]